MATVAARGKQVPHHTSPCTAVPYIPVSSYRDEDEGLDFGSSGNTGAYFAKKGVAKAIKSDYAKKKIKNVLRTNIWIKLWTVSHQIYPKN